MQIVLGIMISLALIGISIYKKPAQSQRVPVRVRSDKHLR